MRTLKLTLSYDGTRYAGWQVQPKQLTLQGVLEQALAEITGETIRVVASGRTDAGVHALGQVVSFQSDTPLAADVLQKALNAQLPGDMAVVAAEDAADGFHAIRDCVAKRYRYVVHDGGVREVFGRAYAWHYRQKLDERAMDRAAQALLGRHDFSSFETGGPQRSSSVRTISEIFVRRAVAESPDVIHCEVEADGFLYNMVRAIVGTLVEVGRGVREESWPGQVLAARDRGAAGMTAPPLGLFLMRAEYLK